MYYPIEEQWCCHPQHRKKAILCGWIIISSTNILEQLPFKLLHTMSSPIQKSHFREKWTLTKVELIMPEFNPDILQPVHQAVLIHVRSDIHHHHHCLHFPYAIMLQPISKHEERNWIHCRNCNMKCEKQSPSTSNSVGESCICKKNSWSLLQQPDQLPIQFLV